MVFFWFSGKAHEGFVEELKACLPHPFKESVVNGALPEGDAKVTWVHFRGLIYILWTQMQDHLIAKKIQGGSVRVASSHPATKPRLIKIHGFFKILTGHGQMKYMGMFLHTYQSNTGRISME